MNFILLIVFIITLSNHHIITFVLGAPLRVRLSACIFSCAPFGGFIYQSTLGAQEKELFGGELGTTNNRMELMAVIEALNALSRPCEVIVHTDSQYVQKGISEWIHGWKARGWKTAAKAPVKNEDLWKQLDQAQARHKIEWRWVRGHNGHAGNERADALANRGVLTVQ